jgi:DNA-binding helix-hairpin-helix protein with protein kinase domain
VTLTLARRLGAGGEAEVYEVAERPGLAYKRYRTMTPERLAKLRVMLASPPDGVDAGGHVAIAWPVELADGGFLMPRIDLTRTVPLFQVYNPASRVQIAPGFTWRYLLRTARNVAAIVDSLHRAGYVVGDINESNLLVNTRALATLVDCDSMQVRDPATGVVHRGGVGKPEFTAPELQGQDLSTVDRTVESDDFAVAVLVFQLLCEGVHPFAGVWKGRGDPPDVPTRMRRGLFPYRRGTRVAPSPFALPLSTLPPELRRMAWRTFTTGVRRPSARPRAAEWVAALERAEASLRTCDRSSHHVFAAHLRRCPWCGRIDGGLPDPFPGPTGVSTLTRREPPRWVRARAAVAAWLAARARRAAAWVWARIGPPLRGWVPLALSLVATAALVPLATAAALLLAFRLGEGRLPSWVGRPPPNRGWVGVRWALVLALVALYALRGTSWWPVP